MTWSKGHFQEVARIVAREREKCERENPDYRVRGGSQQATRSMADEFARVFTQQNPRFDGKRFFTACGIKK